ncbi:extracellular solute-binding protein [Paenibacillus radicis (ex Xue et al. 2023)]|uniref:Extracellular solute-binding protein n=1 Tax=Paenibacillus radicis (ex Xue et al. 2023) TaxID=2972489 RepID=A0ABT1YJL6_9BACL|nr:extracellular solute-binding protein [Paenibacillus radicis (ex Xue et al. 2023)]MCR8632458.1 extracellular solute-binding protein [Paenibacillus radicis (ex Xue et al. 2023)]
MNKQKTLASLSVLAMAGSIVAGCGGGKESAAGSTISDTTPFPVSIALTQVGDIPSDGNEINQAIEKYTNTKLNIQWIPNSAYDDKVNVMIASSEMPKLLKVQYVPNIISNMQSDLFWEVGPYLKDYKNLAAQSEQFYDNIKVDGKVYGVPVFSEIARAAIVYRKDWLDNLGLKVPKSVDDWYNVAKAMTLNDPDKNGKNDTYGVVLFKRYNEGQTSLTTRFAVGMGAPNKWEITKDGNILPEFMSPEYTDVLKMYRKLYDEKLLNQDFAVLDSTEADKMFDSGRVGIKIAVATTAKSQQDRLSKVDPKAVVDVAPLEGPKGIRVAGQTGNSGIYVIPKSSVKTEAEMKRVLKFLDQLMDPEMATLLMRGIENKHYVKTSDNRTEFTDFTAFQREVKPYRDNFPYIEGYNVLPLKDVAIGEKGTKLTQENMKSAIPNPALTFISATYSERGKELEQMIYDAQTKYIMGKIDDAGYQAEIEKWKKSGGQKLMDEYKAENAKRTKK